MTLRQRNVARIRDMFQRFQKEVKEIINGAINIAYFMRGGMQYHDVYELTPVERDMISDFLRERIEKELKSPHPVY